jgi:gamma-glutamyltranspeptidase/glutathione hydrolase
LRPGEGQLAAALTLSLLLFAGCGSDRKLGEVGAIEGFIGGVATDEPNATVVAQDVLSAGGTAADAAIAAFFTLTVTYPIGAGIGGGGTCVVYDAKLNEAQTVEFLPARPGAQGAYAVPGAVRGLSALHARYGRLGWSALVAPAEQLARFGHPVSRAFANRLAEADRGGLLRPPVRKLFERPDGALKREGDKLERVDLAGTLGSIRAQGAGALYGGATGRALVEAAGAVGASIGLDDLRAYRPVLRATRTLKLGDEIAHVALPPPVGGAVLLELLQALRSSSVRNDPARLLAASEKAYGATPAPDIGLVPADTAVAVGDREGSAVACAFSMGRPFGAGVLAPGTGVLLAPVEGREDAFLAPMVLANHNVNQAFMAIAASGGWAAPIATAVVALRLTEDDDALERAIAAPRAVRLAANGPVRHEAGWSGGGSGSLVVEALGRVQAIWCPAGLKRGQKSCRFASDPRGQGLARGEVF